MPKKASRLGVVGYANPQKKDHRPPADPSDPLSLPSPARVLLTGGVSSGKSTLIGNLLSKNHPWDHLFLMHANPDAAEWSLVKWTKKFEEFPPHKFWDEYKGKKLGLVIDDVDLMSLSTKGNPSQKSLAKSTVAYCSSHHNLTVFISQQSFTNNVPVQLRRLCSHYIFWTPPNRSDIGYMARGSQMDKKQLEAALSLLQGQHDFIMVENDAMGVKRPRVTLNGIHALM